MRPTLLFAGLKCADASARRCDWDEGAEVQMCSILLQLSRNWGIGVTNLEFVTLRYYYSVTKSEFVTLRGQTRLRVHVHCDAEL